jgi:amidase
MARSVPDLALLLSVMAGYDPRAPLSVDGAGARFLEPLEADFRGKRVAWLGDFNGFAPHEPGVLEVCRTALKTFEDLGCVVEEALPDYPPEAVWAALLKLRAWQASSGLLDFYRDPANLALLKPEVVFEIESGFKLSAFDITEASTVRSAWSAAVRRLFERYDYLVAPTAQVFPFDAGETWPRQIAGQEMGAYHEWMKANFLVTMSGCPALAVPAGFSPQGLPIGLQIVAPVREDMACLQLGHAYDQAAEWTRRLPPLLTKTVPEEA